jgi:hypothetical protein
LVTWMSRGLSSAVTEVRNSASAEANDVMRMMLDVWVVWLESPTVDCECSREERLRGQIVNTVIVESAGHLQPP